MGDSESLAIWMMRTVENNNRLTVTNKCHSRKIIIQDKTIY